MQILLCTYYMPGMQIAAFCLDTRQSIRLSHMEKHTHVCLCARLYTFSARVKLLVMDVVRLPTPHLMEGWHWRAGSHLASGDSRSARARDHLNKVSHGRACLSWALKMNEGLSRSPAGEPHSGT